MSIETVRREKRETAVNWHYECLERAKQGLESSPQSIVGRGEYWDEVCGIIGREKARHIMYRAWAMAIFEEIGLGKPWGLAKMCLQMANQEAYDGLLFYGGGEEAALKLYAKMYVDATGGVQN